MSEKTLISQRAQKVLTLMRQLCQHVGNFNELWIRQGTLAEHFECSRTSIWRALNQLKEAGLITDLNKRHEYRYKTYQVSPPPVSTDSRIQTQMAEWRKTYGIFLNGSYAPKFDTVVYNAMKEIKETMVEEKWLLAYLESHLIKTTQEANEHDKIKQASLNYRRRDPTHWNYWRPLEIQA